MFKIGGMTCVACSGSIERLMHSSFDTKGMHEVSIVLLMHKMVVTFDLQTYEKKEITPEEICEEVEMIGFDCELTHISEIQQETQKRKTEVKK